jgi:hypothetical protein
MPQPGFFDLDERFAKLDGISDTLVTIRAVVDWEPEFDTFSRE